jgi:hypothetical protein
MRLRNLIAPQSDAQRADRAAWRPFLLALAVFVVIDFLYRWMGAG